MRNGSKVLVDLGRIAYISAAACTAESRKACEQAREEQAAGEAGLRQCTAERNRMAQKLIAGGRARALHHSLAFDGRLAGRSQELDQKLDRARQRRAEAERVLAENQAETRRRLARLRLAEKLLHKQQAARRRRRERRLEEEVSQSRRP